MKSKSSNLNFKNDNNENVQSAKTKYSNQRLNRFDRLRMYCGLIVIYLTRKKSK